MLSHLCRPTHPKEYSAGEDLHLGFQTLVKAQQLSLNLSEEGLQRSIERFCSIHFVENVILQLCFLYVLDKGANYAV